GQEGAPPLRSGGGGHGLPRRALGRHQRAAQRLGDRAAAGGGGPHRRLTGGRGAPAHQADGRGRLLGELGERGEDDHLGSRSRLPPPFPGKGLPASQDGRGEGQGGGRRQEDQEV